MARSKKIVEKNLFWLLGEIWAGRITEGKFVVEEGIGLCEVKNGKLISESKGAIGAQKVSKVGKTDKLKIIDFEKKGNMVKFYLGKKDMTEWYGDDWDDKPYEHNAGEVYSEFVAGEVIVTFGWDDIVREPCDGYTNSSWCKDDMVARKVPCIAVLEKRYLEANEYPWEYDNFDKVMGNKNAKLYYLGDEWVEEN